MKAAPARCSSRSVIARAGLLLAVASAAGVAVADEAELARSFGRDTIVIEAAENGCYRFDVWLAETAEQHRRGLMHVRAMPRFTGMLFIYDEPARRSMWMKNTYIPLDMLFIRADGTVASIAADTEPLSLRSIASDEPVQYVLELNAGVSAALGIEPGDRIHVPALSP